MAEENIYNTYTSTRTQTHRNKADCRPELRDEEKKGWVGWGGGGGIKKRLPGQNTHTG